MGEGIKVALFLFLVAGTKVIAMFVLLLLALAQDEVRPGPADESGGGGDPSDEPSDGPLPPGDGVPVDRGARRPGWPYAPPDRLRPHPVPLTDPVYDPDKVSSPMKT